jgi:hypothetical protein
MCYLVATPAVRCEVHRLDLVSSRGPLVIITAFIIQGPSQEAGFCVTFGRHVSNRKIII